MCDVLPNPVVLAWRHCSKPPPRTLAQPCREPPPHLSPPGSGCCTCSRCSAWLRRSRLRRHHNACVLAVQALAASDRQPTAADPRAEEWSMAHINMANNCEACTTGYSEGAPTPTQIFACTTHEPGMLCTTHAGRQDRRTHHGLPQYGRPRPRLLSIPRNSPLHNAADFNVDISAWRRIPATQTLSCSPNSSRCCSTPASSSWWRAPR